MVPDHEYEITDIFIIGDMDENGVLITPFTSGFDVTCFCGEEFSVTYENDEGAETEFSFTCDKCLRSHWVLLGEVKEVT